MSFKQLFPNVKYPILCGPMANVSGWELALRVSQSGGLGLIGGGYSTDKLADDVKTALQNRKGNEQIGFGLLTFTMTDQQAILDILDSIKDSDLISCIWLFGGGEEVWVKLLRRHYSKFHIIIQVHTVEAALEAKQLGADIIVAQGSDAGGHGGAESSSILTLVPEIIAACPDTPVLAAGGISNGLTMYAAMTLGAQAVVLGTRFMLSQESLLPQKAKELASKARDGGKNTVQTRVYDEMRGTTDWPMNYTGRAIRNLTIQESLSGRDQEDMKRDYKEAIGQGDYSRLVCWAGTGIGMINEVLPTAEIIRRLVQEYNTAASKPCKAL